MRAADTDRIQVAQLLTDAAAQGQLQLSEYEDRLTRAYAAQTYDELDRLSADLAGSDHARPQRRSGPSRAVDDAAGDHERLRAPRPLERAEAADDVRSVRGRRGRPAVRRLHLTRRRDPLLLDLRRPDHPDAARGERGPARRRRDGHLRPERERRRLTRRAVRTHPRLLAVGQRRRQAQEAQGPERSVLLFAQALSAGDANAGSRRRPRRPARRDRAPRRGPRPDARPGR